MSTNKSTASRDPVPLKYRFTPLSHNKGSNDKDDAIFQDTVEKIITTQKDISLKNRAATIPSPLILKGRITKNTLLRLGGTTFFQALRVNIYSYELKYPKNNTTLSLADLLTKEKVRNILENSAIKYHTFAEKGLKQHVFLLRGLCSQPDSEEVVADLVNQEMDVQHMSKLGMFFKIVTSTQHTLKDLQKDITHLLNNRVYWEDFTSSNKIPQFHKCQE